MYPTMRHPNRHVWDFWYYYDLKAEVFHIFYLNADPALVPDEKHHFASQIGYGTTTDFLTMEWITDNVLCANKSSWDNTSIWSGDIIQIKDGFLLFYTSRDSRIGDGLTQNIGAASVTELKDWNQWKRVPEIRIEPNSPYELHSLAGDTSIHAWRDPFLFWHENQICMLLSAKSIKQPLGRKGAVGLLRSQDGSFAHWNILEPICDPGWYSEMEVPQIYRNPKGEYELVYSTWAKGDFALSTNNKGGLHSISSSDPAELTSFHDNPCVLLPEDSKLYACRIIPEMDGEIVGFDTIGGGIRRSGVKTELKHVDRNFSQCSYS